MQSHSSGDSSTKDNRDTVEYLLDKQVRKKSDYDERDNFILRHEPTEYKSVLRVYIDSLDSPLIKLYYSKFDPHRKVGTLCIIHGYGESSDEYLEVPPSPPRPPPSSPSAASSSTSSTSGASATPGATESTPPSAASSPTSKTSSLGAAGSDCRPTSSPTASGAS